MTLLLAILAPWAAQAQETLTVNDGTTTNEYVPVYGYWADNKQQSEFIIPSASLTEMAGSTLQAMKFYANYDFTSTGTFQVYLREVENSTFSNTTFYGTEGAFTVYTGTITVSSTDGMTITFANDGYVYNGGNLLIGFFQANGGNCSSNNAQFYGISADGASISMYGSNSARQRNFLPKTTFTYEPAASDCPKPNNFVASNVTAHTADLSWESDGFEFVLQYKKASQSSWNEESLYPEDLDFPYTLTNLTAETEYQARVAAIHETCPTRPRDGRSSP